MHKGLLAITKGGDFEFFKLDLANISNLDLKKFPKHIKKLFGKNDISREADFVCKNYTISIFAFQDGKAGQENKFELPPPIDTALYFGCLIVIAHNSDTIMTITQEMFNSFYNKVFEGFVNLDGEDTWSEEEEENTEDREFIVDDNYIEYDSKCSNTEEEDSYNEETEEEEFIIESEETEEEEDLYNESDETEEEEFIIESEETDEPSPTNKDKNIGVKIKINII